MPQRSAVELVPNVLPLGHEFVHEAYKCCIVRGFQEVEHLVQKDIFQALTGLLG